MAKPNLAQLSERQLVQLVSAMDTFNWLTENNVQLTQGPWQLAKHEYQLEPLQEGATVQCCKKGAQMGWTEIYVLQTLHGMIHEKYPAGSLYLFPTRDDVKDFSKARFDPLIESNPCIKHYVQSTDSQNIKRIGKGFLYLRGARSTKAIGGTKKTSSQLKSIPVDRIVFDERDEMEDPMVELAKERVAHSPVKELIYLGTPTIPEFGIDALYDESDQRVWMLECQKCGKETCLELEFPECLQRDKDGRVYRACKNCGAELHPAFGTWRAQYPNRSNDLVGWWVSQLNSMYVDPGAILNAYEDPPGGDLSEVYNSKLGQAYVAAENKLTQNDVFSCCGQDAMLTRHEGPTCMGVDVGKILHVVIAERKTKETLKVVKLARVSSFNDLHDLAKRFNVKSCVIDLKPEIRKVRDFQKNENFSIFACDYVERRTGQTTWDEKDMLIKTNRTEICDATHELVVQPGSLELPRINSEVKEYAKEMCNMAKVLDENTDTGAKEYRYKKLKGNDHYRHATNYCLLASQRVGTVSDQYIISSFFNRRKRRTFMTA